MSFLFLLRLLGSQCKVGQFQITVDASTWIAMNKDFRWAALMFPQTFVIDPQPKVAVSAGFINRSLGVRLTLLNVWFWHSTYEKWRLVFFQIVL